MYIRKIGGLYWLRLGRLRIAVCIVKAKPPPDPLIRAHGKLAAEVLDKIECRTTLPRIDRFEPLRGSLLPYRTVQNRRKFFCIFRSLSAMIRDNQGTPPCTIPRSSA